MFHVLLSFLVELIKLCQYLLLTAVRFCHAYHALQESVAEDVFLQRLVVPECTPGILVFNLHKAGRLILGGHVPIIEAVEKSMTNSW
jgi:hypothetical protein